MSYIKLGLGILFTSSFVFSLPSYSSDFTTGKVKIPFEAKAEIKSSKLSPKDKTEILVNFDIQKNAYLYKDRLSFKISPVNGLKFGEAVLPKSEKKFDLFLKHEKDIYSKSFSVSIPVSVEDKANLGKISFSTVVRFQGCSKEICFLPQKKEFPLNLEIVKKK